MFSKYFSQKAIGFSLLNDEIIRYAIIHHKRSGLVVEKTAECNLNCKTALHRLQQLFKKYPAAACLFSKNSLLVSTPLDIKSRKDQQSVVKNKVESLIQPNKIKVVRLNSKKKKSFFLCVREKHAEKIEKTLSKFSLPIQNTYSSLETVYDLKGDIKLIFSAHQVELIQLQEFQYQHTFFDTDKLKSEELVTKLYKRLYEIGQQKVLNIYIYGHSPFLEDIKSQLEKIPTVKLTTPQLPPWLHNHSDFLHEIAAAQKLTIPANDGLMKANFANVFQVFRKPLLVHLIYLVMLLTLSGLYWNFKIKHYKQTNHNLLVESFSKIAKSSDLTPHSAQELTSLLKKREKGFSKASLTPEVFPLSDCLSWLSEVARAPVSEEKAPIVLESFKYSLNKPSKKNKTPSFAIQLRLAFTAESTPKARDFYQKVVARKDLVDTQQKITWEYHHNTYHMSFFLKPFRQGLTH